MQATIIQIGNSRGVRIPKIMLEESGLGKDIEIKAKRGEIKITPFKKSMSKIHYNEEYLLSLPSLARDWDTPEEDAAWAHLQ